METLPSLPIQPLLKEGNDPWGMFDHIKRYPWVLGIHRYRDLDDLLSSIKEKVIAPAEAKVREVRGEKKKMVVKKIISGGQTGIDRAALDVALELGIPCGGWCPKGRKAEDGPIDARYPLTETSSSHYQARMEKNVMEADGTLVLTEGVPTGGTAFTIKMAEKHKKPCLVIDLSKTTNAAPVIQWAKAYDIKVLNMAGPRESKIPGISQKGIRFLREILVDGWDGRKTRPQRDGQL